MTTTAALNQRLDTFARRIMWVRIFELKITSLPKMADALGPGYKDSTVWTWEEEGRIPRNVGKVAKRYADLAQAAGAAYVTRDWILDGETLENRLAREARHSRRNDRAA